MTPERHKLAVAKFGQYAARLGLHGGSPLSLSRYEGAKDGYIRGFGDGVEHILETSSRLEGLETSIKIKDIRLEIVEKELKHTRLLFENRKKLHSEAVIELKTVIDRLSLIIGLRDPALLKSMEEIRNRLEVSDRS